MKKCLFFFSLVCLFFAASMSSYAQRDNLKYKLRYTYDTTATYVVTLVDGNELSGHVVEKGNTYIVLKSSGIGEVTLPLDKILSIVLAETGKSVIPSKYINPFANHYFVGPSALPVKKGEAYYQNTYLFINTIGVGITDHLSVSAGAEILSFIGGRSLSSRHVFYVAPKMTTSISDKWSIAGGGVLIGTASFGSSGRSPLYTGYLYGVLTRGTRKANVSLGLSSWLIDGASRDRFLFYTLSGSLQVNKHLALQTENWIGGSKHNVFDSEVIYSYGIRIFAEKLAFDFGFFNNPDIAQYIPLGIPFGSLSAKF